MNILILGAGGIGGYFGARLLQTGADVTFLVREKRQQLIAQTGLQIETPKGNFSVQPRTVTASTVRPDYDLIVLAPKAYDLDDALASLAGADSHGVLLPFLNGLNHMAVLDAKYGRARVLGGVAHIAATLTDSGAVRQLTDMHKLSVGPRDAAHEALARAFIAACQKAEFDSLYSDNIEQLLWDKWVFLATLAGMTTVNQGSVGEIVATPHGLGLMRQMYAEGCAAAQASGHPIAPATAEGALRMLTTPSGLTASMLRDLQGGQRTEHEHILGALAKRGLDAGLPMDLLRLAHTHLAVHAAQATAR